MPYILNIETATEVCSVAISNNSDILFERENLQGPNHASLLGLYVDEAIKYITHQSIQLDAVSVSSGPGSYTGLRIGVSQAKGVCYGMNIPLIAIKTPLVMAQRVIETNDIDNNTLLCPMIDARRMEVYATIYDKELNTVRDTSADIIDQNSYQEFFDRSNILFFGNGAQKCQSIIQNTSAHFLDNLYPSARFMLNLSNKAYAENSFVDLAYFEPYYLKEFVGTVSKKAQL